MSGYFSAFLFIIFVGAAIYFLLVDFSKLYNRCKELERENKELKKQIAVHQKH